MFSTVTSTVRELARFIRVYRKYWLAPILLGVLLLGLLVVATQGSGVSTFIYALF